MKNIMSIIIRRLQEIAIQRIAMQKNPVSGKNKCIVGDILYFQ